MSVRVIYIEYGFALADLIYGWKVMVFYLKTAKLVVSLKLTVTVHESLSGSEIAGRL